MAWHGMVWHGMNMNGLVNTEWNTRSFPFSLQWVRNIRCLNIGIVSLDRVWCCCCLFILFFFICCSFVRMFCGVCVWNITCIRIRRKPDLSVEVLYARCLFALLRRHSQFPLYQMRKGSGIEGREGGGRAARQAGTYWKRSVWFSWDTYNHIIDTGQITNVSSLT